MLLRTAILIGTLLSLVLTVNAQTPDTLWSHIHNVTPDIDEGKCVRQTADDGYIITGACVPNGMVSAVDVMLLKADAAGNMQWLRTFDRTFIEDGLAVEQTSDEGYIIGGRTCTGPYPITIQSDVWILKTDSSGDTIWTKTYGGDRNDYCTSIQQTSDMGYILAGTKDSEHAYPDYEINHEYTPEDSRLWLLKTDANGDTVWTRTYLEKSHGTSVVQTPDGGYIICGYIFPNVGDNRSDVLLIKTDAGGDTLWTRMIGEAESSEIGLCIRPTQDGYVISGQVHTGFSLISYDALLIKTDLSGNVQWQQTYGGYYSDAGYTVEVTTDGGFFVTGTANGQWWLYLYGDMWVFETDPDGNLLWENSYDLAGCDLAFSGVQCNDGCFVVSGMTSSGFGGDLWLAKIGLDSPDLVLMVDPYGIPIIIPTTGGTFDFNIEVFNNEPGSVQFDLWTYATLPGGMQYGPIMQREGAVLSAGASASRDFTQNVPANAPEGDYTYDTYVGIYPDEVWDEDHFDFSKSAITAVGSAIAGWDCRETGHGEQTEAMPHTTALHSAHPDPFNPSTVISYQLSDVSFVNLSVYDVGGRKVAELVNGWKDAGVHEVMLDGSDLTSGVYLYRLETNEFLSSGKMVLMK